MDFRLEELKNIMTLQTNKNTVVANNLANVSTTGYKRDVPFFEMLSERTDDNAKMSTYRDYSQGPLKDTGNQFDVALKGSGYFTVMAENKEVYTRDGHFSVDNDGFLVTKEGNPVMGQGGWINLTIDGNQPSSVSINSIGEIYSDEILVGKLLVNDFENPDKLMRMSGNYYTAGENQLPQEVYEPTIVQGKLEGANLSAVSEMINLIEIQRNFESAQTVSKVLDSVLQKAATKISTV